jgi:hypothetical protein
VRAVGRWAEGRFPGRTRGADRRQDHRAHQDRHRGRRGERHQDHRGDRRSHRDHRPDEDRRDRQNDLHTHQDHQDRRDQPDDPHIHRDHRDQRDDPHTHLARTGGLHIRRDRPDAGLGGRRRVQADEHYPAAAGSDDRTPTSAGDRRAAAGSGDRMQTRVARLRVLLCHPPQPSRG